MGTSLGIDVGTSSVKVVLVDEAQKVQASASSPLKLARPQNGWSEQQPDDWWKAAVAAIGAVRKKKPKAFSVIDAIGLSGQMHGATLLDRTDVPIRPAILWNDGRAEKECRELEEKEPGLREIAGNIAMPGFTAPKLLWVKKHEPENFRKIAKVLLPKDYVRLKLSGDHASDMSDSSGTLWMNVAERRWSGELLAATNLSDEQMPQLFEGTAVTGDLSQALQKKWGLARRPVVAGGGGDNAAAACGIGAVKPGESFVSLGTSGVLFVSNERFSPNTANAVHAFCHAIPRTWHQMGVMLSATASLEWLARVLGEPAPRLTRALGQTVKGPAPVLFLPYLSGERTPVNDAGARGVFCGLGHESDRKVLTHAVLDGVAFAFRDCLEALRKAGTQVERATAVGGGSKSKLWLKIIATVLGIPIDVPVAGDFGAAFGAARLGLVAMSGADPGTVLIRPKMAVRVDPDSRSRSAYEAAYQAYVKIYPAMKGIGVYE
ncbi:MAG TPA: xylulokinase [Aestuariivirgaceae bacterium]|nr:xylulokinase [Aestuariivirgaceae bacterium]